MKKIVLPLLFTLINLIVHAQAGAIDTTFNPTDIGFGNGSGANDQIYAVLVQPDGKVIIGGIFTTYNATACAGIARLNANGTLDATFAVGTGTSGILSMALQTDGKIIIGGSFTNYNGIDRSRIARLNTNGSLDTSFDVGSGINDIFGSTVQSIAIQSDGKILVGGSFSSYNG